jgi:NADP-dependent alcohol dehydrogenase
MNNFSFHNPVKVLFGRGQIAQIAKEIPAGAKVLITAGGGSIKQNGVYDQVKRVLAGFDVREFWGIEPNPRYETLMKAVEQARQDGVDFLLAVGGGSVVDGTKFIAAAVGFAGDPWDIVAKRTPFERALPLGAVMTLPATGSEMNSFFVVTRESQKLAFGNRLLFPRFSVLDPESTFSLPARQIGNGIVDAFTHTMEQYLTYPNDAPLQDRFAEGILQTLIEVGPRTYEEPTNYEARATLMWAATMALNGVIGVGVPQDWATHSVGHELTALHGIDHARTLALVLPAMLSIRRDGKRAKLLQYAERVWGLRAGSGGGDDGGNDASDDARIDAAIAKTQAFFESVGVPTKLSAYGLGPEVIPAVVERLGARGEIAFGERRDVGRDTIERVLQASL